MAYSSSILRNTNPNSHTATDTELHTASTPPTKVAEQLVSQTIEATHGSSYQNTFLLKLFGGEDGISNAIFQLRNDRVSNTNELTKLLGQAIAELPKVNAVLIEKDPLLSLLVLILNGDSSEDHLRDQAAENYIRKHPEDKRFEKAYAYLRTPHILVAHLLIISNQWKCANPENNSFYDEQIAGLFHGTLAFDKGDQLSPDELIKIKKQEGENPRFPIANKLEKKEDNFVVKDWCCTPPMCPTETRLDDLFIPSRRAKQEVVLDAYLASLKETSSIIQKTYGLPSTTSTVVAVIGPYGAGKSKFTEQKFKEVKNVTTYDLDKLNSFMMEPSSRPQDHHFEAMMLTNKLLPRLAEIPALLTETAGIDEYRFNRMVNRDFSSRDRIIVEEIAPENISDTINRFIKREGGIDQTRIGAATTSANDALKFRANRIDKSIGNSKIHFTLYCNPSTNEGNPVFIEVAKIREGVITIINGQEDLYKKLIGEKKV